MLLFLLYDFIVLDVKLYELMETTVESRFCITSGMFLTDGLKYPRGTAMDVWATGVLAFCILTSGSYPFPGISKEVVDNKILNI